MTSSQQFLNNENKILRVIKKKIFKLKTNKEL